MEHGVGLFVVVSRAMLRVRVTASSLAGPQKWEIGTIGLDKAAAS